MLLQWSILQNPKFVDFEATNHISMKVFLESIKLRKGQFTIFVGIRATVSARAIRVYYFYFNNGKH